jgi:tetratricopeptide (TPR) repeat protein
MRDISATFEHWRKGIECADASGEPRLRAEARSTYSNAAALYGYFDLAKQEVQLAIEILEELDDVALLARCHLVLGWLLFDQCFKEEAVGPCTKALELAEQTNNKRLIATALYCKASTTAETEYAEANRMFDRSIAILRHEGGPEALGFALYNRAMVDYQRGNLKQAEAHIIAAFKVYMENGISLGQVPLTVAGNLFCALGNLPSAEACWMRAERARRRHKMALYPLVRADFESELARHGMNEVTLWARFEPAETETDEEFARRIFLNPVPA